MKNKIAIAISMALVGGVAHAATDSTRFDWKHQSELKSKFQLGFKGQSQSETDTYIIKLKGEPLATYKGGVEGYPATSPQAHNTNAQKLDTKSAKALQYKSYLKQQRDSFLIKAQTNLGTQLDVLFSYDTVFNGLAVKLSPQQAKQIAFLPEVESVTKDFERKLHSDRGPTIINAPSIWDGSAAGAAAKGEGMVIGIIDTGINHDSPSFAEVDPIDGYTHTNPLGDGVYKGDCLTTPGLCNNKLIGSYNFLSASDTPEDDNGHGSHVAGTAGGNHVSLAENWEMSGVAPRANIISYKACCEGSALMAAIEQAVEDEVDAINYSIGASAPFQDPWNDFDSLGFKAARAAGIFVATSAGNDGSGATTVGSPANAPWLTSVAATTHDRGDADKTIGDFSGGDTTPPNTIDGQSITGAITAPIVYAGSFSNGDENPEQCLNPFPEGTFTGQIVICDRGEIARVAKAENVALGGAGGFVLANVDGGDEFIANDAYVIPGIHIAAEDGNALKTWVATGEGHTATISEGIFVNDPNAADVVAGFSSRGPNGYPADILTPNLAAPGVNIVAPVAGDADAIGFLSGTSMASPHVAGAAVLVKQLRPTWTPGQIHSALATTGSIDLVKEDGETTADMFDIGGGRIDIAKAVNSGLVMDETDDNFTNASPSEGGAPKSLNLPSMIDADCFGSCSWTRTVTATSAGSWTVTAVSEDGMALEVTPSEITLTEGESATIEVAAEVTSGSHGSWHKGAVFLTPSDSNLSTNRLPIGSKLTQVRNLPPYIVIETNHTSGSYLLTDLLASDGLAGEGSVEAGLGSDTVTYNDAIAQDPTRDDPFDDVEQVFYELIEITEETPFASFNTYNSESPDLDLFVGIDKNGDGLPQYDGADQDVNELLSYAATSSADETVELEDLAPGTYWVIVQNWEASADGAVDNFSLDFNTGEVVTANLSFDASNANATTPFNATISWEGVNLANKIWEGNLNLTNDNGDVASIPTYIVRYESAPTLSVSDIRAGEVSTITVNIDETGSATSYAFTATMPEGVTVEAGSGTGDAVIEGNTVSWSAEVTAATSFTFDVVADASTVGNSPVISMQHNIAGRESTSSQALTVTPSASISGLSTVELRAGKSADVSFSVSDTLEDENVVTVVSTNGGLSFTNISTSGFTVTADKGMDTSNVTVNVTVTDAANANDTVTESFTVSVTKKKSSGSFGWLLLPLLGFAAVRRKLK